MKKIVTILLCLLCALCTYASSMYSGYAQAPVAKMTSTSSMMRSTTNRAASEYQVYGIRTVASSITGGVTSNQTYSRLGAPRRAPGLGDVPTSPDDPRVCQHCHWELNADGDYECTECHAIIYGGCECTPDCHCPLPLDWTVMGFFTLISAIYAAYKTKKSRA